MIEGKMKKGERTEGRMTRPLQPTRRDRWWCFEATREKPIETMMKPRNCSTEEVESVQPDQANNVRSGGRERNT
jgi:hypothetical protein